VSGLILPGLAADRYLRDKTARFNADVTARSRTDDVCERFNRELRQIDRRLEMRFFGPEPGLVGAVPNRYTLVLTPEVGPKTLIVLHGPRGEFMEPTSAVFAKLAEGDLWNADARRDRDRKAEAAERARDRQRQREQDDRNEELRDRYNAATRTWVSMNRDSAWTQNASPAARRDARNRRR
jgi:hypothetical protein